MIPELKEKAFELRKSGWTIKAIADELNLSTATISSNVRGAMPPCQRPKKPKRSTPRLFDEEPQVSIVFKDLPDEVLFKHVPSWDFIG